MAVQRLELGPSLSSATFGGGDDTWQNSPRASIPLRYSFRRPFRNGRCSVQLALTEASYGGSVKYVSAPLLAVVTAPFMSVPAGAQNEAAPAAIVAPLQTPDEAIRQDAAAVADLFGISSDEAQRALQLQEASVTLTDEIVRRFAERFVGIAIDHKPGFRITVLLTGDAPVADEFVSLAGEQVVVRFRVGAPASHAELVQAISAYQATMRSTLVGPPGLGIDQRTGDLVVTVSNRDVEREGLAPLQSRLSSLTRVPVRVRAVDQLTENMSSIAGGTRMVGSPPGDPRRYMCTAGFVVTDGARTALTTAAHCPDLLSADDIGGHEQLLAFVGQWGWGNQDVQINASPDPLEPVFLADTAKTVRRPVTGARGRAGTRAGDIVCHRGERTGYSCATIELTDFAPAGDLCGGACLPTWTTVSGPVCKGGDSGSPVFLGTTAYGIVKGGSYRTDGSCAFYFYMSIDYLPTGCGRK